MDYHPWSETHAHDFGSVMVDGGLNLVGFDFDDSNHHLHHHHHHNTEPNPLDGGPQLFDPSDLQSVVHGTPLDSNVLEWPVSLPFERQGKSCYSE